MDVSFLKQNIAGSKDLVERVFTDVCYNVSYNRNENAFRGSRSPDSNPTSIRIDVDNLGYVDFARNRKGDIVTLVMHQKGVNFPDAVHYIAGVCGIHSSYNTYSKPKKLPFGAVWEEIESTYSPIDNVAIETYPESVLDEYHDYGSMMFLEDGISVETQKKFGVKYDGNSHRIILSWRNNVGDLVGATGRYNKRNVPSYHSTSKYISVLPFPKKYFLYGYNENYANIIEKGVAIITEGEKGVMQLDSMGLPYGLAGGKAGLSQYQRGNLKVLGLDTVILSYDEGLEEDFLISECEQMLLDGVCNNVFYIYDKDNEVLPKGSKNSPTDSGLEDFQELIANHLFRVELQGEDE